MLEIIKSLGFHFHYLIFFIGKWKWYISRTPKCSNNAQLKMYLKL